MPLRLAGQQAQEGLLLITLQRCSLLALAASGLQQGQQIPLAASQLAIALLLQPHTQQPLLAPIEHPAAAQQQGRHERPGQLQQLVVAAVTQALDHGGQLPLPAPAAAIPQRRREGHRVALLHRLSRQPQLQGLLQRVLVSQGGRDGGRPQRLQHHHAGAVLPLAAVVADGHGAADVVAAAAAAEPIALAAAAALASGMQPRQAALQPPIACAAAAAGLQGESLAARREDGQYGPIGEQMGPLQVAFAQEVGILPSAEVQRGVPLGPVAGGEDGGASRLLQQLQLQLLPELQLIAAADAQRPQQVANGEQHR